MSDAEADASYGLIARLEDLIAARPEGGKSAFAPRGKVRSQQFGGYRSAFRGRGMEFDEVRLYQAGDDIRTIDWRVTARTGRTHTKLFQEERERPVLILLDCRSFMRFGTRDTFKSVLAAKAAAVLTWISIEAGDRVGGVIAAPSGLHSYSPQRSRARVLGFVKAMADGTQEGFALSPAPRPAKGASAPPEPSLAEAVARLRRTARPGTLVFLISDFHDFTEAAARELSRLALQAQVTNLFVYDALEEAMPARGAYPVSDGAAVRLLDGDNRAMRETYAGRFAARRAALDALSRQRGMAFVQLQTGDDPAALLHPERLRNARRQARKAAA
ncbi:DUF58 domain-containing protein [Roseixanthobacter liquoris]|uniref:DUF58 domain-containing protein n=1 Tax=Roseixanthobacter liquoris TaxID=3119921 RepID=UPI00372A1E8A